MTLRTKTVVKFEGTNMACMGGDEIMKEFENNPQQNDDALSRNSLKHKLQERHDFFVNAYGGFSNLPQNDKSRVDEITNCIAMVVNEPPVISQQKSIECDDDEVSREACLMCLTGEFVPGKEYKPEELIAVFSKRIRALPPVTVRQTGEWIIKEDNTSYVKTLPRRWAECSKCEWSMSPGYVGQYAFCPNCGSYNGGDKNE